MVGRLKFALAPLFWAVAPPSRKQMAASVGISSSSSGNADQIAELTKLVEEAQQEVARHERALSLAKTSLAFYRKALRQAHVAKLSAAHGLRLTLSDAEDPEPDDKHVSVAAADDSQTVAAVCKLRPLGKKHTADGQCRACYNLDRNLSQQVGHLDGPPCKRLARKRGRPPATECGTTAKVAVGAAAPRKRGRPPAAECGITAKVAVGAAAQAAVKAAAVAAEAGGEEEAQGRPPPA